MMLSAKSELQYIILITKFDYLQNSPDSHIGHGHIGRWGGPGGENKNMFLQ